MPSTPGVGNESAPKAFGQGSWQDLTGAHKGSFTPEWGKFLAGHPGAPLVLVN
jgi:hypothetical protein